MTPLSSSVDIRTGWRWASVTRGRCRASMAATRRLTWSARRARPDGDSHHPRGHSGADGRRARTRSFRRSGDCGSDRSIMRMRSAGYRDAGAYGTRGEGALRRGRRLRGTDCRRDCTAALPTSVACSSGCGARQAPGNSSIQPATGRPSVISNCARRWTPSISFCCATIAALRQCCVAWTRRREIL